MAKWIKGQSGNPKGRPRRGRTLADLIKQIGAEVVRFDDEGEVNELSRRERLARILWTAALEGDTHCARLILEYTESKPGAAGRGVGRAALHDRRAGPCGGGDPG